MTSFNNSVSSVQTSIYERPSLSQQSAFTSFQYAQYADTSLETQSSLGENIQINIDGNQTRNSFMSYVVYHIIGRDKNGAIDVYRRFNEFYKMRTALIKRFPGCFIPSIPEKSISLIDDEIVNKRQRYLNDFVRRMAKLPHLYNSEEFQALLRSAEKDLSGTFEKWPNPSTSDIINKYKENFSHLAGKVIDESVKQSISNFIRLIQRANVYMYRFKIQIKSLAMIRDKLDRALSPFLTKGLADFEKNFIAECGKGEEGLIFGQDGKLKEKQMRVDDSLKKSPYWLLYDLVKREERDGCAFLECTKAIQEYEQKKYQIDIKIGENNKAIAEVTLGKKSNSELKYKLEVENESLKRQKDAVQCLTDIITAIVVFVEMKRFKDQKRLFYLTVMRRLGGYELSQLQVLHELWGYLRESSGGMMNEVV